MDMEMKKTARTALLSALFTVLLAPGAFAEKSLSIDLQTAIDKAFKTHADIKKAEYTLDAARADYNAARESFGPKVSLSHSTGRGGRWNNGTIGNSYNNSLSLSIPIFDIAKNASEKIAKAKYQSSVLGDELAFITMKQTVSNAYYTLLAAIDAQQVCSAQQDLIKAENRHSIAEARLNNMIGIDQDTKLKPVEELGYKEYKEVLPNCINYAMLHRLDLQQSRLQVKAAEAALNGAKAGWLPSVTGVASNSWHDGHWPGNDNSSWSTGFRVDMNVFDSGITKSNVAKAKANLMVAKESYRQDTDNVELDVRTGPE